MSHVLFFVPMTVMETQILVRRMGKIWPTFSFMLDIPTLQTSLLNQLLVSCILAQTVLLGLE